MIGTVPVDPFISEFEMKGRPLLELPDDSPAVNVVAGIMARMAL